MNQDGPKHLDVTLTRAKFDELTSDLVDRTMQPVRQALSDADLKNLQEKTHSKALTLTNVLLLVLLYRAVNFLEKKVQAAYYC